MAAGCQIIVPSAQRGGEICIGPPTELTGRLAGMPEFVAYNETSPGPKAPRPKFHPVPTRPVFTPWKAGITQVVENEPVIPLLGGQGRGDGNSNDSDASERIDLPPGFQPDVQLDEESPSGRGSKLPPKTASTRKRTSATTVWSRRRSRWAEVRVVE